jgi:hypothetical protein
LLHFVHPIAHIEDLDQALLTLYWHLLERTWIGREVNGKAKDPMFHHEKWNEHDRILNDLPNTNNALEAVACTCYS